VQAELLRRFVQFLILIRSLEDQGRSDRSSLFQSVGHGAKENGAEPFGVLESWYLYAVRDSWHADHPRLMIDNERNQALSFMDKKQLEIQFLYEPHDPQLMRLSVLLNT
jgi:hypothetical protein